MSYYAKINKETKRIISFEESTSEIVEVKTRAEKPKEKEGFDFVEKAKRESDGTYTTEWVEVKRELTEQEKNEKRLREAESNIISVMDALVQIHEGGGS